MITSTTAPDETSRPSAAPAAWRAPRRIWALLAAIVLIAGYFRTLSLTTWDGTSYLHPDERFLIFTVHNLRIPESVGDYFRSSCVVNGAVTAARNPEDPPDRQEPTLASGCNTLNPRNYNWSRLFVYGTLPTTLTRVVAEAIQPLQPEGERQVSPEDVRDVGRGLSTLFDLGSVLLVFLIGRRLYDARVGLLGAFLLAVAALPIQLAHFMTVDAATAFFVLLSVYWSVRAAQGGGLLAFSMLGVSIGGAMACRFTMATLGLLGMVAVAVRLLGYRRADHEDARARRSEGELGELSLREALRLFGLLCLAGFLSLLTWRVLQPDAFVGTSFFDVRPEPRFLRNVEEVAGLVSGEVDFPPSQQWAHRVPYLFPLQNMVVWGMGLPLGVAAVAAWAAAGWQLFRRRALRHAIPWVWVAFYFAWQGGQFVMTMRYYGLLYGLLAMLAAWGLLALAQRAAGTGQTSRRRTFVPSALILLPFLVALGTLLWGFAFTRIYTEPHSRIQASRWIYQNIPPGSVITHEVWDDPLPLNIDGNDSGRYVGLATAPYWEDDPQKYFGYTDGNGVFQPGLLDQLDQADYLIFSSNRVYDSATRLGMRYPALTRYYHSLFSGELGFELAADIHSYPRLFGVELPSPILAEEAFSVYDHPRVLIFRKTEAYSRENAERLITGDVAWGEVYKISTLRATEVPTALRLTDAQWPAYREAGTWSALFNPQSVVMAVPWLFWLLALQGLAFACFGLLFGLLRGLPDRGYALSKPLGLLLTAYLAWLLASIGAEDGRPLVAFSPGGVWLSAGLVMAAGALSAWLRRDALRAFWRRRRAAILTAEGVFLLAFFAFVALRAANPDLWHPARGGEKPMDIAFLNATLKSPAFPPYDPWFAGGYINYYYFGFVIVGALIHMTGVVPGTAYNLAVPTIFALTAVGAWGAAYNLLALRVMLGGRRTAGEQTSSLSLTRSPRWRRRERMALAAGVLAAVFAVLSGNLANTAWVLPGSANTADEGIPSECRALASYAAQNECRGRTEWAFWDATRVVGMAAGDGTINEFPFFTFLYGDLHAHMIALPLVLAGLMVVIALLRGGRGSGGATTGGAAAATRWGVLTPESWLLTPRTWALVLLLALIAGALRATNTWDFPTIVGLSVLGLALGAWRGYQRGAPWDRALAGWLAGSAGVVLGSTLLFLPFIETFATDYAGFQLWEGGRTPMAAFLKVHGAWLVLAAGAALALAVRSGVISRRWAAVVGAGMALLAVGPALLGWDALLLQVGLVVAGIALLVDLVLGRDRERPADRADEGLKTPVDDGPVQLILPLDEPEPPAPHAERQRPSAPAAGPMTILTVLWGLCAVGITLLTEIVTARGDIGRMNSVFKFGMQAWLLFAVASAVGLVWMWVNHVGAKGRRREGAEAGESRRGVSALGWAWRGAAGLVVAATLVYPVTATLPRLADRFDRSIGPTLDGEAFMRSPQATWGENGQTFSFAQDADAIAWVRENVRGTPIILEAHAEAYRWAGRFSIYTGLPTLLGWPWHMTQQRTVADVGPIVASRQQLIQQLYSGTDPGAALRNLRLYGVEYVVVGQLERALYDPAGLAKFAGMAERGELTLVYSADQTQIYQVPPRAAAPAVLHTTLPVVPPTAPAEPNMLTVAVDRLPPVDEYGWNALASNQGAAVLLWLLAWYALLALGLPLAVLVFGRAGAPRRPGWSDGGYVWARLVGLLLVGYFVWLPVSARLWQNDRWGLLIGVLLALGVGAASLAALGRRSMPVVTPAPWKAGGGRAQEDDSAVDHDQPSNLATLQPSNPIDEGLRLLRRHLLAHRREIVQVEGLFLAAFAFMVGLRALNPDLWHPIWGGEKPFEFGFLNAVLRSPVMPPYNPFFSGGTINYYYYGFFLASLPVRATGIDPAVAFNLIVPTLYALLATAAFALAARVSGRAAVGLLGLFLVAVAGNIAAAVPAGWSRGLEPVRGALAGGLGGFGERLGDWFIGPTRVIPNTINEFPYFAFLFADLHPHMIALPITLLMAALCWEVLGRAPLGAEGSGAPGLSERSTAVGFWWLACLTLGALAVTNSWDFPTYGLLFGGALLGRAWRTRGAVGWQRLGLLLSAAGAGLLAGGAALLLYLPFFQNYQAMVSGVALVEDRTSVGDYMLVYGVFLAVLVPALFGAAWRLLRVGERAGPHGGRERAPAALGFVAGVPQPPSASLRAALAAALILVVLIAVAHPLIGMLMASAPDGALPAVDMAAAVLGLRLWLAALIIVGVGVLLSRRIGPRAWFATWLAVVGWVVSLLFEVLYIRDHLAGGDWYRMNTVFKFGLQAWVLMALAAALALPGLWRGLRRYGPFVPGVSVAGLGFLAALALVYPLVGTPSRAALRFPETTPPTLDGLAFLGPAVFTPPYLQVPGGPEQRVGLKYDGEAIDWLLANVRGTPVVAQSSLEFYRSYGTRVAANTGFPTIVSPLHESEQRDGEVVAARDRDVQRLFQTLDEDEALRLLSRYRVGYVYVGRIERLAYGTAGAAKWDLLAQPASSRPALLEVVFRNAEVTIYRVDERVWTLPPLPQVGPPEPVVPREQPAPEPAPEPQRAAPAAVEIPADLPELEAQVQADPYAAGPAFALAQRYWEIGRPDDAAAVLATAATANQRDVGLHHLWGDILLDAGRYDEMEAVLWAAIEADPSAGNYNKLGVSLLRAGRFERAVGVLQQAIGVNPAETEPYLRLGQAHEAMGDRERAAEQFRQYLAVAPADAPYRQEAEEGLARVTR